MEKLWGVYIIDGFFKGEAHLCKSQEDALSSAKYLALNTPGVSYAVIQSVVIYKTKDPEVVCISTH